MATPPPPAATVETLLFRRAVALAALLERWRVDAEAPETLPRDLLATRRALHAHVETEYGDDVCAAHRKQWVHGAVAAVCDRRSRTAWRDRLQDFHASTQTQLRAAVADCPDCACGGGGT